MVAEMLAAFDWQSAVLGALALIVLIGAVLGALGQIGRAWTWVMQRFRPAPPRIDLESSGGVSSHQRDEATGEVTWEYVRPSFTVRNDEPVAVYALTGGIVNPAGDERIEHPQRVPILKAETQIDFGSTESFQIPQSWLAGFAGTNEHRAVPYFVAFTDVNDRRWDGVIDYREITPRLRLRRVKG
jgi:hypothetical protein